MIKKVLLSLLVLVPCIAAAQYGAGEWIVHPTFAGSKATNCIDTGSKIYSLVGSTLYCYDKESATNTSLDKGNLLSDVAVSQIFYNSDKGYLVVAYSSCNLDVILPDGRVHNIPDYKDAILHKAKAINDVTFAPGEMVVATNFGFITFDDDTWTLKERRIYEANFSSVAVVGDYLLMSYGNLIYYSPKSAPYETIWGRPNYSHSLGSGKITPIAGNKFFLSTASALYVMSFTDNNGTLSFTSTKIASNKPITVQHTPSGFVASFFTSNYYYTFDSNGDNATKYTGNELYTTSEDGNWWVLGTNGLAHIVGGVKSSYIKPAAIDITTVAYWLSYDKLTKRMILSSTDVYATTRTDVVGRKTEIDAYKDGQWSNILPASGVPTSDGNFRVLPSAVEPGAYYFSKRTQGVVKVKDGAVQYILTSSNSPTSNRPYSMAFDSQNNLWMVNARNTTAPVVALPADKVTATTVKSSDFFSTNIPAISSAGFKNPRFGIGKNDTKFFSGGQYRDAISVWTSNDDLSTKQSVQFNSFTDQDSKSLEYNYIQCLIADNDGLIWVGHDTGVFTMDPDEVFGADFRVQRVKVPRNDGTPLADVLLDGIQVNSIACDNLNRKWLGTNGSGIYLVSPDGTQILKNFTTQNSYLSNDIIYDVCCDLETNAVFVVTPTGVVEYLTDATPAEDNYDNVYAYPSPVKPDFTGLVTIKGLMDSSYVTILDSDGTVVYQTVSTGGVATWSACDSQGNRLPTGTYLVKASQTQNDPNASVVTKILVIK